jgi:hypothetical protein
LISRTETRERKQKEIVTIEIVEKRREEKEAVVVCFLGTPFEFGVCK